MALIRVVGAPLPLAGEGDQPQAGGGGCPTRQTAQGAPPFRHAARATSPRKREKGPDCELAVPASPSPCREGGIALADLRNSFDREQAD